jgi:hypothetical protein
MAAWAISIHGTQGLGAGIVFGFLVRVVLMLVVTKVLGRRACLMLAIRAHGRPTELQWEQCQQKDDEPTTHKRYSSHNVFQ